MEAIERPLLDLYSKLPPFPDGLKQFIHKVYPWVLLIFSALGFIGLLVFLGLFSAFAALAFAMGTYSSTGTGLIVSYLVSPLSLACGVLGGFWMIGGKKRGWDFALYSQLLAMLGSLIQMHLFSVIFGFVWLWALFQIREYYVNDESSSMSV